MIFSSLKQSLRFAPKVFKDTTIYFGFYFFVLSFFVLALFGNSLERPEQKGGVTETCFLSPFCLQILSFPIMLLNTSREQRQNFGTLLELMFCFVF